MATDVERPDRAAHLTPGDVAALFGVTPKTIGRWAEAGLLPVERTPGGHRRFPAEPVYDLFAFLEGVGEV